jgi:hypothetical protein
MFTEKPPRKFYRDSRSRSGVLRRFTKTSLGALGSRLGRHNLIHRVQSHLTLPTGHPPSPDLCEDSSSGWSPCNNSNGCSRRQREFPCNTLQLESIAASCTLEPDPQKLPCQYPARGRLRSTRQRPNISSPKESPQNQTGQKATIPQIPLVTRGENFDRDQVCVVVSPRLPLGR